jgi:hypothetical protein
MAFKFAMMVEVRGINATLCSSAIFIMARLVIFGIAPCMRSEGLLPSRCEHNQARTEAISIVYLQLWFIPVQTCSPAPMKERIRGKSKRGSPWKPRRPPVSPSASPMTGSSPAATPPPVQSVHLRSVVTPSPSQSLLLHSMATIP